MIYATAPETPDSTMAILPPLTQRYVTLSIHSATLSLGEGILLTATLGPAASGNYISWQSSNPNVAQVINGFVSAISPGTATITVYYEGPISQPGATSDTCVVTVTENQLLENGTYFFENASTGNFAATSSYSSVYTQALSGGATEKWYLELNSTGVYYTIRSMQTGGYLFAPSTNNAVSQTSASMSNNNRFRFVKNGAGKYALVSLSGIGSTPTVVSLPSSGSNLISAAYTSDADYRDEWNIHRMLPTSGSELTFGMPQWTGAGNGRLGAFHCYGYAINNQTHPNGSPFHGQYPGKYADSTYSLNGFDVDPLNNGILVAALHADYDAYNENNGTNFIVQSIGQYDACPAGTYKIALVVAPSGESASTDYHWYRQDSDGLWSHKRGSTEPTREDASGNLIIDPQIADRNYGTLNYTAFIGYFAITPWNHYCDSPSSEYLSIEDDQYFLNVFSLSLSDFDDIHIGMTIAEVTENLGCIGIDIGGGRVIMQYSCTDESLVNIGYLYSDERGTLVVSDIYKGGAIQ